ncbi:restriction endonuclease subunit S [Vibrio parahaemolyticus]|nr:restriction endonuclease subunit S [Vibrio parahaemolyticus]EQL93234.1 type I restriction modification DNA specificity domain protein [Vibrio parahaemolyticus VP2007-095]EHS2671460.1 restriction endonuclease subunit S [Vibrio parahaemolyticus]EHZ7321907.1 restriction endonuclease subunit S [Vibrio parahaemolyticus]EIF2697371.1 restriction endonuclease subunit S [Vibrio parahaemolyticus]EIF8205900.1 restriction endonuclease subunit S [Vibrio parahaemolyticus]
MVELGSIANFINGFAFKPEHWEEDGKPIIRIQNLTDSSKSFNYSSMDIPEKYHVVKGDLLVSWSATLDVFEWHREDALLNQHIFKVEPNFAKVNKDYLRYALRDAISAMLKFTRGSTMKHVNRGDFLGTKIPLPPLETQKQIAAVLEKADQLRKDCQQMEQELNSLAQSVFIDMFGDPVTNPKGWEVRSLKEFIVALRNGRSPSKDGQFDFKVLTLSAITRGHYNDSFWKVGTFNSEPEKTKKVTKNDFLICRGNGNKKLVGRGVYSTQNRDDLVFPDTVIAATLNLEFLDIRYFNALWSSDLIREHIESGARTTNGTFKINQKVINDAPILFPPLELQKNFGSLIENITVLIEQNQKQLKELDDNFNALMQKAFKGELNQ